MAAVVFDADRAVNEAVYEGIKDIPKIPELSYVCPHEYAEVSVEERLHPIIQNHDVIAVAGAFFGDEGKGKTVDDVAHHPDIALIARVNSGENAGHTVVHGTKKFAFHLAPSGVLSEGRINVIGAECVMDPVSFMGKEIQQLVDSNIPYDNLYVGNVQIVTPYHKLMDYLQNPANASTLKGMSPAHAAKVMKRGVRMDHLFNNQSEARRRFETEIEAYLALLKQKGLTEQQVLEQVHELNKDMIRIPPHVVKFLETDNKCQYLFGLYKEWVVDNPKFPKRCDAAWLIRDTLAKGKKVMLEGPQSYWLSNACEKFWPSSTSADTSASGLVATAKYNFQRYRTTVLNIHKTPASSRVGLGANPSSYVAQDYFSRQSIQTLNDLPAGTCTDFDAIQRKYCECVQDNGVMKPAIWEEKGITFGLGVAMACASAIHHGECGTTTRKPRVCGLFDCVAHAEVMQVQGPYTSISALDRGDDYDKVGIVVAYVYHNTSGQVKNSNGVTYSNGQFIKPGDALPNEHVLYDCHPIIMMIDGWKDSPLAASKREKGAPLPKGVQQMIGAIEHFTGADVLSVGNGPALSNFIYVSKK